MLVAVDLHAGLPAWWTLVEGPSVLVIGVAMYVLNGAGSPSGNASDR